jgi:hypothetical protein
VQAIEQGGEKMRKSSKEGVQPRSTWSRRLILLALWLGVAAGAYLWGRTAPTPSAAAEAVQRPELHTAPGTQYSGRDVAYLKEQHGSIPITREELGEFLIARYGKEKLKHLINKRIIEQAAKGRGLEVTEAEVDATLSADASQLGISLPEFINTLLKRYNKTLFEWKEDVIKPRLLLEKMSRARVLVTREDLFQAYQAYFGEKVDCQMIIWPREKYKEVVNKIYPAIRDSEAAFEQTAKFQISPSLAAAGGHIKPVGHNTLGNPRLEAVLFKLKEGEISEVMDMPEGLVVVKCLKHIEPNSSVSFDACRADLEKEVFDKKVSLEVTKMFQELYAQAKPTNLLEQSGGVEDLNHLYGPTKAAATPFPAAPVPGAGVNPAGG